MSHLLKLWRLLAGTDLRRHVLETYGTRLLVAAISFATTVVISRTLGPEDRGLYAVATTMGAFGVQFGNLGLHASNTYNVAKDRGLLPALIGNTFAVVLAAIVVTALIGIGFDLWPARAPVQGTLLVLALASVPFGLAYFLYQWLLLGIEEVRAYNKIECCGKLLTLMLISAVALGQDGTTLLFYAIYLGSLIISLIWVLLRLRRVSTSPPVLSLSILRQSIDIGMRAYLILLFGFLVLRIDLLMVKYLLGAREAGYYSISQALSENIMMFPATVGLILLPRLSVIRDRREKCWLAIKAALVTTALMVPLVVLAALAAAPVVSITFGREFLAAVPPFVWLMPGIYFLAIETVLVQLLNSEGFPPIIVAAWIADSTVNIALNFWAIPRYGITGASIVSSVCYFLMFVTVCGVVWRRSWAQYDAPAYTLEARAT